MTAAGPTSPDPTGAGREPGSRVRLPVLLQTWASVAFVHWRVDRQALLPLVPDELEIAERDGSAWVSLVLFCASDTRPPLPGSPTLPPFAETNLRTYVRTEDGREGIWFLSLEAASSVTAAGGSAVYGVPYHLADATVEIAADTRRYRSRRTDGRAGHDLTVRAGPWFTSDERTDLDDWLTGRWRAFSTNAGVLLQVHVEHEAWPLRHATLVDLEEDVLASVGLTRPATAPLVHASEEVHVRLGPPTPALA